MWGRRRGPRGAGFPARPEEGERGLESPRHATTRPGRGEFEQVARHYDTLMAHVPYGRWVDYVERLVATAEHRRDAGATGGRRVLDLACGTGKVGSELRRRGYEVVGADLSEQMAAGCRTQQPPLPVAVMDATRLGLRPESFDLVVCLYDSLNYVLQEEGLQACFRRVYEALAPGGLFIFDLNTPRALKVGLFTQQELRSDAPVQYRWEAHWDEATKVCRVDMWFKARGDASRESRVASERRGGGAEEFTETHYERAYEEGEVKTWLKEAGFEVVRSYDAYTLFPVGPLAERMFFVGEREW